jgi:hypothetical protein
MLYLYRRHIQKCRYWTGTNGNRDKTDCRCPVWVDGFLAGKRANQTLDTRNWTLGLEIIRDWEIAGTVQPKERAGMPVCDACAAFLADAKARHLSYAAIKKYHVLLVNEQSPEARKKFSPSLVQFCDEANVQFSSQITLAVLTRFRAAWKDGAASGGKKLERLRAFGRFLVDQGWWPENLALKLKRPRVTDPPTMPYTTAEMAGLLAACDLFTDWHGNAGQENAQRLRALILFLRYSALRIRDATSCPVDRLAGNKLFLYTQKTGVPVNTLLPPFVVDALKACPRKSENYWFWTGAGSKESSPATGGAPSAGFARLPELKMATLTAFATHSRSSCCSRVCRSSASRFSSGIPR